MKQKKLKGSMTVEMAIVFPIVLFTILGILSMCMVHYQNIVAGTAAMQSAARGAMYWDKLGGTGAWDFQARGAKDANGKLVGMDFESHDPYRYLLDSKTGTRKRHIGAYTDWILSKNPKIAAVGDETGDARVNKTGGILQKYVTVSVEKQYTHPLGNTFERVGIYLPEQRTITASAPLNTPTEFIRNCGFLYDLAFGTGG